MHISSDIGIGSFFLEHICSVNYLYYPPRYYGTAAGPSGNYAGWCACVKKSLTCAGWGDSGGNVASVICQAAISLTDVKGINPHPITFTFVQKLHLFDGNEHKAAKVGQATDEP